MSYVASDNNSTDTEKKSRTIRLGAIAPSRRERLKIEEVKLDQSDHALGYVVELENHTHFKVIPAGYSTCELFLVCDEDFPTEPPIVTVKKQIYGDGGKIVSRRQIRFESAVVANWNETCSLLMIADEFVATRKTSLLSLFSPGNTGKLMRIGLGIFAILAMVTLAYLQNSNENVAGLYSANQPSVAGTNYNNNPGASGVSSSGRGLADSGTLRGQKDEISEFTALFLESVFEYRAVAQGNNKTSGTLLQIKTPTTTGIKIPTPEPAKSENIIIKNKLETVAVDTDTPQVETVPAQPTTNQPTRTEDRTEDAPVKTKVAQPSTAAPVPTTLLVVTPNTPNITTTAAPNTTTTSAPASTTVVTPEPTTTTAAPNTTDAPVVTTVATPEPTTTTAVPTTTNAPTTTTPAPTTSAPTTSAPTPTPTDNKGKDKTPKPTKTPKPK